VTVTHAERVRRQLEDVGSAGMDLADYAAEVLAAVGRAVPFDSVCLATADPGTQLLTRTVKVELPDARDGEFAHFEYEVDDVNLYEDIARRPDPVGVLDLDTGGHPEVSARWRDFLMPHFDIQHEMRAAFRADGSVWGYLGLYRRGTGSGFSPAEAEFISSLSPIVARGLRAALVTSVARRDPVAVDGPAVLVVDERGEVASATPAAVDLFAQLGWPVDGPLPTAAHALACSARAASAGRPGPAARIRVRTPGGRWYVMHAAPLRRPDAGGVDVVLTLEPAGPHEVVPLVVEAHGLTPRERDIVALVLAGESTAAIASRLHLSPYTVQDHLKSIFDKAGVRSRRELTAQVFFDHYAPRIGSALGPSGWFAG
jgi:DNA-binding CsgD family transcriptional regulator